MANRNVFEALNATPEGGAPKNPFDLFNLEFLTSKVGQFIPVGFRETVPDADYRMSVDNYTFTFPCNTASLADMKENYYFLFVPYYLISRNAYALAVNRKDNQSALDYQFEQLPSFRLGSVVARCIEVGAMSIDDLHTAGLDNFIDIHGFNIALGALRLLDLCGYGCYLDFLQKYIDLKDGDNPASAATFKNQLMENLNRRSPNVMRLAAYQKSWYCYFRNSIYDNDISPRSFNFDDVTFPSDTTYNILDYRMLDDFIIECCQLRYVQNKKDVVSASMPGTQFGAVSSVPLSFDLDGTVSIPSVPSSIPEASNYWSGLSRVSVDGVSNATLFGTNDGTNDTGNVVVNFSGSYNDQLLIRSSHSHPDGTVSLGTEGTNLFDVLQLTEAQAIQKWRQKAMLAGSRTKANWKAHYGTVPRHLLDDYPDFIGSVDNPIMIDKIISQANTLNAEEGKTNLGDLAGRGYGASDRKVFHFHSSEYGVLILCRAIIPENVYTSFGLDRANQLIYYTDLWQSEFQNIGLDAVPKLILDSIVTNQPDVPTGEGGDEPLPSTSKVIGYAPRNYQLKMYRSKVHGYFNPSRFVDVTFPDPSQDPRVGLIGFGELEAFVQLRRDVVQKLVVGQSGEWAGYGIPIALAQLYVDPSICNSTFGFDADSSERTDQFIHKARFNCSVVQPLTTLGLPQF